MVTSRVAEGDRFQVCLGGYRIPEASDQMDIFKELGDLVLGSVPTMIFFVLLVATYGLLVRGPLDKVLAERRVRTTGAVEQARGAIAAAEAETAVYEDKLRSARAEVFAMREARLAAWQTQREVALTQARNGSQRQVDIARQAIEASAGQARAQVEAASGDLATRVLAAILPAGHVTSGVAQ
jgi:F-type H+-transporting ATPase subunit b